MIVHPRRTGLVAAVLVAVAGSVVASPGIASARATATEVPASFQQAQQQLEQQLANRSSELARLAADVAGAKSLTAAHANLLNARLQTEAASISALVAKVPSDTTRAELRSDRQAMLRDNRVYGVTVPQVFETIEADAIAAQVTVLVANEPALEASMTSVAGEPGYKSARNHYNACVSSLARAGRISANVATVVLNQSVLGFPHNTHVFVHANEALLRGDLALAHASYDATVVGFATGGHTGP